MLTHLAVPTAYSAYLSCQIQAALLTVPKLPRSPYLLCGHCSTPAQETSPLALQTEGMCLLGDGTGEIRGLTAERGRSETAGEERGRDGGRQ
ncbi:hypothetical protein CgunFtcFv8_011014 [Champsocephalus gunnari]|uniref:Uncharacterized protein n=1 Tax=Champsocephalus gunnari TaxID=52237 RepID=A0AAN8HVM2_CHAGU|nr:hypothetical protein CgunFtcFv8_011014 [Champsocephalus gunnari]